MYFLSQLQGTDIAPFYSTNSGYYDIGTTDSLVLVPLYTSKYTIDFNGKLNVLNINCAIVILNDANAECKIQISGDGGITFIDITNEIGYDIAGLYAVGPGLWINEVQTGNDKLQVRILGRSTDGNPATVRMYGASAFQITISKDNI